MSTLKSPSLKRNHTITIPTSISAKLNAMAKEKTLKQDISLICSEDTYHVMFVWYFLSRDPLIYINTARNPGTFWEFHENRQCDAHGTVQEAWYVPPQPYEPCRKSTSSERYSHCKSPGTMLMQLHHDIYFGFSPESRSPASPKMEKSVECLFIDTFLENFKNATSILSLLAFGGITELEMTYATLNIKIYHQWLYLKDYLSPLLAEKRCGVWYLSSARVRNALMSTIN